MIRTQLLIPSINELFFYFTIYSLGGWLLENVYNVIRSKPFFKPNFLVGPFKPMYGFAPVLLLIIIRPNMPLWLVLSFCFLIPLVVEYFTGWLLVTFFGKRYWDYRDLPFQLHGHIALGYALCWIVLSYSILTIVHPYVQRLYQWLYRDWKFLALVYFVYFSLELLWAIKRHLHIKNATPVHR